MNNPIAPTIPDEHIQFAKAVADLAEAGGIDCFSLKYKPDYHYNHSDPRSVHGEITINYTKRDQRGRPSKNLDIYFDCHVTLPIIQTESSY